MNVLRLRLYRALILRLVQVVHAENTEQRARGYLEDLGYDGCKVCEANRRRMAWTLRSR